MAEVHIIGQILSANSFEEPNLFCKWSIQFGSNWKHIEGAREGQTATVRERFDHSDRINFSHPIDIHLASRGIQGWPKFHVEIYAVTASNTCWPVGFGFGFVPTKSGTHRLKISTWKIQPNNWIDSLRVKFNTGGYTIGKSDLIYSGVDRYKLSTQTSGFVILDLMLVFKNFDKFGVNL